MVSSKQKWKDEIGGCDFLRDDPIPKFNFLHFMEAMLGSPNLYYPPCTLWNHPNHQLPNCSLILERPKKYLPERFSDFVKTLHVGQLNHAEYNGDIAISFTRLFLFLFMCWFSSKLNLYYPDNTISEFIIFLHFLRI